ncbi:MAG TPA: sulfatase [Methyloceanibacter sp.]|jgi:N-acetylglucosamine-6-sulfatase|nr:sulfatase [Methyloceanibacter sp.]
MRLFAALVLLLASVTASEAAPNIVVIMTDDQEDTGSMAYMPKLHALLAEQGVTFTNSFVNLPLCAPSRASFLTGLSAHNTGIKANNPADGGGWEAFKDKEANALPVWLDRAGYKTALLGKYVNRYGQQSNFGALLAWAGNLVNVELKGATIGNPRDWVPPGWDLWYAFTEWRARYFDYAVNENGTILHFGYRPDDYSTDVLKERATRFIADQASKPDPFFMLIATKAVHAQGSRAIPAPRDAQDLEEVKLPIGPSFNRKDASHKAPKTRFVQGVSKAKLAKAYRAELQSLQSVDDLVEAVVDALNRAGKLDDTLIVYTADNGFLYGQHRLIGKSAPYEESIKVPLVMRGPGIPKDETRAELVNNLDVVATIAELAGVSPDYALDGHTLAPLFADANAPWRSALLIESPVSRFQRSDSRFTGVRTATLKYVRYDRGFEQLFDLRTDPYELRNEAGKASHARDLASLRSLNEALKSCTGASCFVP